jgi:3-deoxy-manno-octulosonate cytidylyltransferase (CMP-KDO synthetase)
MPARRSPHKASVTRDRVLAVIPARLASERLPRKPLLELAGRPLIEWVWRRAHAIDSFDACVVATDSEEIAERCRGFGAHVEMTRADHATGTERVAEVARMPDWAGFGVVVNVQGDEPFIAAEHVTAAVAEVRRGRDIGTVAAPVGSLAAWRDPAVVKVVRRSDGTALYFSRAPIPHLRGGEPAAAALQGGGYLRHIGVYACGRDALLRWVALPPGALERVERLEQLRALEAGLSIGFALVAAGPEGVDTPADAARAEAWLRATVDA